MKHAFEAARAEEGEAKLFYFAGADDAAIRQAGETLASLACPDDIVLIKASRSMALERVTQFLQGAE